MLVPAGLEVRWPLQVRRRACLPHQGHRKVVMACAGGEEDSDGGGPVGVVVLPWWVPGAQEATVDVLEPRQGAAAAGRQERKWPPPSD